MKNDQLIKTFPYKKPALNRLFYLILLTQLFAACGKEKITIIWDEQTANNSSPLTSVFFTDENTGHIVGGDSWYQGYYLSTTDAGATWSVDSLSNKRMYSLQFLEDGFGITVGIDGYLYRKETPAAPWKFLRLPKWVVLRDVAYKNREEGIVVGGQAYAEGILMRIKNNVVVQLDTFENELASVCYSDDSTVHIAGFGIMLRSDDGGHNWTRLDIDGDFFRSIHFPSPSVGYIVGSAGTILKTTDGGQKWKKIRKGEKIRVSNVPFRDLFFTDESRGYVVGENGTFWRTTNGGSDWEVVKDFPDVDLTGVYIINGHGYLVSEEGRIFHFLDE